MSTAALIAAAVPVTTTVPVPLPDCTTPVVEPSVNVPDGTDKALDFSLTPVLDEGRPFAIIAEARDLIAASEAP